MLLLCQFQSIFKGDSMSLNGQEVVAVISCVIAIGMLVKLGFDLRKEKGKNNEQ